MLGTTVPASAATPSCDDPDALQTSITDATATLTAARAAFHAANRRLGRLVSATRHDARLDLASSRAQLRAERRAMTHDRGLLDTNRAVLAEIKADRVTARAALVSARAALQALREVEAGCTAVPPTP